jgi:hypothetical protein
LPPLAALTSEVVERDSAGSVKARGLGGTGHAIQYDSPEDRSGGEMESRQIGAGPGDLEESIVF